MPERTVLAAMEPRLLDAEVTDDLDDNNAEGETRQRVHSVVALEKAGKNGWAA